MACKCMLYCILFSSQSKAPKEKMDKKGGKCRICDVYHIPCAKPAPQRLLSPLNFDKFRPFFVLFLSFFHKTIDGYSSTAAGLATGKHRAYVGGTLAANPLSCLPIYTATFSSVRRLTRRCCPKPAPKQCKTEPNWLRFVSASYRAPSANTPQSMIYPSRSQAAISAR